MVHSNFHRAIATIAAGAILVFIYRRPDTTLSDLVYGSPGSESALRFFGFWLVSDFVRPEKRRLVYVVYFLGALIAVVDILALVAVLLWRSST